MHSLLKATGYFEFYDEITEMDIRNFIINQNDSIDEWLLWSENKRSNSGWFFQNEKDNKYHVGYLLLGKQLEVFEYSDKVQACTSFIIKEIEEIRKG
jgi:hypothetical protein